MKTVLVSLLLLALSEARLDFDYTTLFDMNDFKGTPDYPIRSCNAGCRVYLTYLNEAPQFLGDQDNGPFTIVVGGQAKITFKDLNKLRLANGEKGYLTIPAGTTEFVIHNPNGNFVARPLALWVVPTTTPMLDALQVFEAADVEKIPVAANAKRLVLMSVSPFVASGRITGEYSLIVKPSPFEMLSNAKCMHVLKTDSTKMESFTQMFNSPLISFGFESTKGFTMTLETYFGFPDERSIDQSGYLASPGYIGCTNATFRSESYNYGVTSYNETFLVAGTKRRHVTFYGDLDTDDSAPILLYDMDTNDEPKRITGLHADNTNVWQGAMDTSQFSLHWDSLHWRNESFMIRYEVDASAPVPTVNPKATTSKVQESTTSGSEWRSLNLFFVLSLIALLFTTR